MIFLDEEANPMNRTIHASLVLYSALFLAGPVMAGPAGR